MKQLKTQAIVLTRVNFGEADRIITFLTTQQGKVRVIAKAVRKSQSKLAGGIELFSVTEIGYVLGRGELGTLTSTRLVRYCGHIVEDIQRTQAGYEFIKLLNRATEDNTEPAYFNLLEEAFKALDDFGISLELTNLWFRAQLLKLAGHTPNLTYDSQGAKLSAGKTYDFDSAEMTLVSPPGRQGALAANQIKFLRLLFSDNKPAILQKIEDIDDLVGQTIPLVKSLLGSFIRI